MYVLIVEQFFAMVSKYEVNINHLLIWSDNLYQSKRHFSSELKLLESDNQCQLSLDFVKFYKRVYS
jgi:uncharacterized protein YeeX (DUF496 family)